MAFTWHATRIITVGGSFGDSEVTRAVRDGFQILAAAHRCAAHAQCGSGNLDCIEVPFGPDGLNCRRGRAYLPVHELRLEGGDEWDQIARGELPSFVDGGAFRRRVVSAIEGIVADHAGRQSVLVVCHAGVINAYLGHVLGIERGLAFPIDYVSISRVFAGRDGRRIVHTVNEIQHAQDLLDVEATKRWGFVATPPAHAGTWAGHRDSTPP